MEANISQSSDTDTAARRDAAGTTGNPANQDRTIP